MARSVYQFATEIPYQASDHFVGFRQFLKHGEDALLPGTGVPRRIVADNQLQRQPVKRGKLLFEHCCIMLQLLEGKIPAAAELHDPSWAACYQLGDVKVRHHDLQPLFGKVIQETPPLKPQLVEHSDRSISLPLLPIVLKHGLDWTGNSRLRVAAELRQGLFPRTKVEGSRNDLRSRRRNDRRRRHSRLFRMIC